MKITAMILAILAAAWNIFLETMDLRHSDKPVPENVRDIYDEETYQKWKQYNLEKTLLSRKRHLINLVLSLILLGFNMYALVSGLLGEGAFVSALAVILLDSVLGALANLWPDYVGTMQIEEKYGFNRSTKKTFWTDEVRNLILGTALTLMLVLLLWGCHYRFGEKLIIVFAAALCLAVLFISFLAPVFLRIGNKFTVLEEGELRSALTEMLRKNGYQVREIKVMDASRRTTKSNAMFTGFGKMKTIILYDNLVANFSPEEICAVFAHEMGHGLHKDTLRGQLLNFLQMALIALLAWLSVTRPAFWEDFGFADVNYGFAFILIGIFLSVVTPFMGLIINARSRRAEYGADAVAVEEGYGEALIGALKKLGRENFANLSPAPINVKLSYSHPTLSDRIAAIEKLSAGK